MTERNIEIIGVRVRCETCDWISRDYLFSDEGGMDCATASAIIETRLGHVKETAVLINGKVSTHKVNLVDIFQD